ncbi:transcription elongation factor [Mycolicibacterium rhodesiae NBB3]|uniref:Transcription elongation factor n=1 Tax=Mycolicibacterium rhodesiae (strain NBB3) TaxID=710685 RepID=G8RU71_MYCRN|nr:GreA/GreB family elongation factor [Mycolicibacterium rhodesiae]AEV72914.1 transcription elongation factor [Mycolicibacterium rhodesiae NBB3]
MTSINQVWISAQAHERLHQELAALRDLCSTAAEDGETGENATAIQRARQKRIQQIHDLLVNAVVGEDPPDDGVAEPGMVVTVRFDDTGETESFLLGLRGVEHGDTEVFSIESPLGAAVLGARVGERRAYRLPSGAELSVTVLTAVPYGLHKAAAS